MGLLKKQKVRRIYIMLLLVYTLYVDHSIVFGSLPPDRKRRTFGPTFYPVSSVGRLRSAKLPLAPPPVELHVTFASRKGFSPGWKKLHTPVQLLNCREAEEARLRRASALWALELRLRRQVASRGRRDFLADGVRQGMERNGLVDRRRLSGRKEFPCVWTINRRVEGARFND